jgi:hypothetical protein
MNYPLIQNEAETVNPPLKPPLTLAAELSASPTCTERKPPFEVGDSSAANPKCTRAMSTSVLSISQPSSFRDGQSSRRIRAAVPPP